MFSRCSTILLFMGVLASAATLKEEYKPEKIAITKRQELKKRSPARALQDKQRANEINRLKQRLSWLENLQKLVHHNSYGSKIFPYEKKILFLKKQLENFNTN